jgi:hypothetical protein
MRKTPLDKEIMRADLHGLYPHSQVDLLDIGHLQDGVSQSVVGVEKTITQVIEKEYLTTVPHQ